MLNLGTGEVLLIAFVALVILGPARLPEAARQAGRAIAEVRRMANGFQAEVQAAMREPERPEEPQVAEQIASPTHHAGPAPHRRTRRRRAAVAATESTFRYHRKLGLLRYVDPEVFERLRSLAA